MIRPYAPVKWGTLDSRPAAGPNAWLAPSAVQTRPALTSAAKTLAREHAALGQDARFPTTTRFAAARPTTWETPLLSADQKVQIHIIFIRPSSSTSECRSLPIFLRAVHLGGLDPVVFGMSLYVVPILHMALIFLSSLSLFFTTASMVLFLLMSSLLLCP